MHLQSSQKLYEKEKGTLKQCKRRTIRRMAFKETDEFFAVKERSHNKTSKAKKFAGGLL
jgi:hypothetical protein